MESITKGQLVSVALKHLAVTGALRNPTPSDEAAFLTYLEMMVSSWTNAGLNIGYKLSEFGIEPDATEDSGIVIDDASGVALNLAVYGASSKGLLVTPQLKGDAYAAKIGLYSPELIQRESVSVLPAGTGSDYCGGYQPIEEPITVENNGDLDDLTI